MAKYLVNNTPGQEAAYEMRTDAQVAAILRVDPGAKRCTAEEYRALVHWMETGQGHTADVRRSGT